MDTLAGVLGFVLLFVLSGVVLRVLVAIAKAPIIARRTAHAKADFKTFETLGGFSPTFSASNPRRRGIAIDLRSRQFALLLGDSQRPMVFSHLALSQCTDSLTGELGLTLVDSQLKTFELTDIGAGASCAALLLETFIGMSYHSTQDVRYRPAYLNALESLRHLEDVKDKRRAAELRAIRTFVDSNPFEEGEYIIACYDFLYLLTNRGIWSPRPTAPNVGLTRWRDIASLETVRVDEIAGDVVVTPTSGDPHTLRRWLHGAIQALGLLAAQWKDGGELRRPEPKRDHRVSSAGVQRCPHCGTTVLPLADGYCPSCGKPMS